MTEVATPALPARRDGPARRLPRLGGSYRTLIATPIVLALAAAALVILVGGAHKDIQEHSALDWSTKLWPQLRSHIDLTVKSTALVLVVAIPLGITLTRRRFRRFAPPVLAVASGGQAVPAYGLFVLIYTWRGTGTNTAVLALAVFTVLPVLRNTMVGLDQVDMFTIEAARGMGMSKRQVLTRIELPLAVPVILAGVRTALVVNVGMAALAFLIGGGGLGVTINSGLKNSRNLVVLTGAAITALLALAVDWIAAVAERLMHPRGL